MPLASCLAPWKLNRTLFLTTSAGTLSLRRVGFDSSSLRLVRTRFASGGGELLRKEVIQPQVPLRLPCYDFTPVTVHSLGPCFPCGLAQALLEQTTPMV